MYTVQVVSFSEEKAKVLSQREGRTIVKRYSRRKMAKKLYVGNLSYGTTSDSLKAGFEKVGTVIKADVLTDKMTGRSRGFGFVEMEDADADKAIAMFDGKDFEGRAIKVNEARPMEERPRRSFDRNDNRRSF
jgi:RNA recognition motif-containing protein